MQNPPRSDEVLRKLEAILSRLKFDPKVKGGGPIDPAFLKLQSSGVLFNTSPEMAKPTIVQLVAWGQYVHWVEMQFARYTSATNDTTHADLIG